MHHPCLQSPVFHAYCIHVCMCAGPLQLVRDAVGDDSYGSLPLSSPTVSEVVDGQYRQVRAGVPNNCK